MDMVSSLEDARPLIALDASIGMREVLAFDDLALNPFSRIWSDRSKDRFFAADACLPTIGQWLCFDFSRNRGRAFPVILGIGGFFKRHHALGNVCTGSKKPCARHYDGAERGHHPAIEP